MKNCTLGCIFQDNIVINFVQFSKLSNLLSKYKYFLLISSDSCVSVVNDNNTFWVLTHIVVVVLQYYYTLKIVLTFLHI